MKVTPSFGKITKYSPEFDTEQDMSRDQTLYEVWIRWEYNPEPQKYYMLRLKLEWRLYLQNLYFSAKMSEKEIRELETWKQEWWSEGYNESQRDSHY